MSLKLNQQQSSAILTPSSAAVAITKSKNDYVQMDALVVLKLVKHCHELNGGSEVVQGILTGMVQGSENLGKRIEITNCFPLPNPNLFKTTAEYDDSQY
jgi:hypothetical protein